MDSASCPEFPWFAYACLNADARLEVESGLWAELQNVLAASPSISVDQAFKVGGAFVLSSVLSL